MNKWAKVIFASAISIGLAITYCLCKVDEIKEASCLLFGIIFPYTCKCFVDISDTDDWHVSLRKLRRAGVVQPNDFIRISFAYLFRIEIDGDYLLVKNDRGTGKYQPVGGVYNCTDSEKHYLQQKMKVADDDKIPIDVSSRNDYRMRVPVKNLKKFVRRFSGKAKRETINDLSREFKEELVVPGILPFENITYNYCGRHFSEIAFSRHFRCYELLMADIIVVDINTEQRVMLEKLMKKERLTELYGFFTEKEILTCGIEHGTNNLVETISDHSVNILQSTAVSLIKGKSLIGKQKGPFSVSM